LFDSIGTESSKVEILGEKKQGTYFNYEKYWIKLGLFEIIKDPLHIIKDYKNYKDINDLPGIGFIGLLFNKN